MPNHYIPRAAVRSFVDDIADHRDRHKSVITLLVRSQRRLAKYVDGSSRTIGVGKRHTAVYLLGVVLRVFDLAGGRIKTVPLPAVLEVEKRIGGYAKDLLPIDEELPTRLRGIEGRAQPHLLDEMVMDLVGHDDLDPIEMLKMFLLMWIVVEVVDAHWAPSKDFGGEETYVFSPPEEGAATGRLRADEA